MSTTSERDSLGGSSLKGRDHTSAATIAAFNKRRLHGDYGVQPNAPSVGIKMTPEVASSSAVKASQARLGPKLWYPSATQEAARASTLASSVSSSISPSAHYVEDPESYALASQAATSAISVTGEEYGAKHQPEAYKWGKTGSQWSHLGAQRSVTSRDEERLTGTASLGRRPPTQSIDISKVLAAAETNAKNRIASAENHLPANFGIQTEEEKAQRRQQVLSLISIADQRVKTRMAELDRDSKAPSNVFGSIEFQKIALDIATKNNSRNLDNHGKLNLGGGLYMTQDEVDDIARRHVQPVLDKVQVVADKKRIADREQAEREASAKQLAAEEKELNKKQKETEKQRLAEEKSLKKQQEQVAKEKRKRAQERAKDQHQQGSHLWHWQQVEIIKEEVKEAKLEREHRASRISQLRKDREQTKEDLAAIVERHRELKKDFFDRGEAITTKRAEYDQDAAETASLFDLEQQRETVKIQTKTAKVKRQELEERLETYNKDTEEAEKESEEAEKHHKDLKKKYFEAKGEAEEAEKKFQIEEEARLKREAEERKKREAEEAERKKKEEQAAAKRKADAEEAKAKSAASKTASKSTDSKSAGSKTADSKTASKGSASKGASSGSAGANAEDELPSDYKAPPKSQLISLGDARTGPVLAGYKATAPHSASHETKEAVEKANKTAEDSSADKAADKAADKSDKSDKSDKTEKVAEKTEKSDKSEKAIADSDKLTEKKSDKAEISSDKNAVTAAAAGTVAGTGVSSASSAPNHDSSKAADAAKSSSTKAANISDEPLEVVESSSIAPIDPSEKPLSGVPAESLTSASKSTSESKTTSQPDVNTNSTNLSTLKEESAAKDSEPATSGIKSTIESVAGAVSSATGINISDKIPLGKDHFSGFDSSNVKENVGGGVFKEEL